MRGWPLIKLLPQVTNFQFVRLAKYFAIVSVVLCAASIASVVYKPGLNMGIDFRGGATMEVIQPQGTALDVESIRHNMEELGIGDVGVQEAGGPSLAMVRFQIPEGQQQAAVVSRVQTAVTEAAGPVRFSAPSVVGSKVSGELFSKGLWALGSAIALMFVYIWFRFEPQFGLGAVAGLVHDVILTFGLIVLMRLEFNLNMVAAILTVIAINLRRFPALRATIDAGANASVLPIVSVASLVGFGAVVAMLPAFAVVRDWVLSIGSNPLVSLATATNILAALTGSASGGLTIALDALGETFVRLASETGIDPSLLHRVAVISAGTLDSLPHNGAVVTLLAVCGTSHRESYRDLAMVAIVGAIVALVVVIVLGSLFGSF